MQVLGRTVLIDLDKLPEKEKSILIPGTSKEMLPLWGTVIQAGPACRELKVGMHVNFPRKSASVMTIDGKEYYLIYEFKIFYYE